MNHSRVYYEFSLDVDDDFYMRHWAKKRRKFGLRSFSVFSSSYLSSLDRSDSDEDEDEDDEEELSCLRLGGF